MKHHVIAAAIGLLALSGAAQAVTYTYTGLTGGAPSFNRPLSDFSGPSVFGVGSYYNSITFNVNVSGAYNFLSTATLGWDNFLLLYSPVFTATTPLVNGLIGNDDFGGVGTSGFTFGLVAGTSYTLVTAGFDGSSQPFPDFGVYTNTITGPGTVTVTAAVVPEPGSYGLMALGLAAVGVALRRRERQAA
jgi:hypothetical protein